MTGRTKHSLNVSTPTSTPSSIQTMNQLSEIRPETQRTRVTGSPSGESTTSASVAISSSQREVSSDNYN